MDGLYVNAIGRSLSVKEFSSDCVELDDCLGFLEHLRTGGFIVDRMWHYGLFAASKWEITEANVKEYLESRGVKDALRIAMFTGDGRYRVYTGTYCTRVGAPFDNWAKGTRFLPRRDMFMSRFPTEYARYTGLAGDPPLDPDILIPVTG